MISIVLLIIISGAILFLLKLKLKVLTLGNDMTKTFSLSILAVTNILLFTDIVSRTLFLAGLPINIVTSFVGIIFLFYLSWRKERD